MDPFPGVDSDGSVFGEQRWGGATSIPIWKKRSLQPAACKLETLVSANLLRASWFLPKEAGEMTPQQDARSPGRAGVDVLHVAEKS